MGGAVAILLAARHPQLVARLVLLEANLDPSPPGVGLGARYTEEDFVRGPGWEETLRRVGPRWAATMRLTDRLALYRTAVHLGYGSVPTMREVLLNLAIPRTYLHSGDHEPAGVNALVAAGVRVLAVPDSGHNIMLDNPDAFVQATAEALSAQPATSTPT
jgi:pimeloyl-ACP methyl ester carboxylesterase